jgi:hypothetical protein
VPPAKHVINPLSGNGKYSTDGSSIFGEPMDIEGMLEMPSMEPSGLTHFPPDPPPF